MSSYWVIAIIILVLGCAGVVVAKRHDPKLAPLVVLLAYLEAQARAARARWRNKEKKRP